MAKKFNLWRGIKNVSATVVNFVWKNIVRWILSILICVLFTVICLLAVVTSIIWVPIWALKNPENCADSLNSRLSYEEGWFACYLTWLEWATHRLSLNLNKPFIAMLPMKYRAEFIRNGEKRVCEYSPKVQIKYYKSHNNETKQNFIKGRVFSVEVQKLLWKDVDERVNWIDSGATLTEKQIIDLLEENSSDHLLEYFRHHTPSKEMMNVILRYANSGFAGAADVVLYLIRQNRPDTELVSKLLKCRKNEDFVTSVHEIMDIYSDLDAVEFSTAKLIGDISEDQKQEIVRERWTNFCKGKKNICVAAQKKMNHEQYHIFAMSGHSLDPKALSHICLKTYDYEYLQEVIEREFDHIDSHTQIALKTEYQRYAVYLAAKEKKNSKA